MIFAKHVSRLQKWIADDAILPADEFRRMADANAIGGDPLNWAYGQLHSMLHQFLKLPEGDRLRYWLIHVCDGPPAVDSDAWARNPKAWIKAKLKMVTLWRAPAWVAAYLLGRTPGWLAAHPSGQTTGKDSWPRLDKKMTQEVLGKFVSDFWMKLEDGLTAKMQDVRIAVAKLKPQPSVGIPPTQQAPALVATSQSQTATGSPGRRIHVSQVRAKAVAKIHGELHTIKTSIEAGEEDYEKLRRANPDFLTFRVVKRSPQLRERIITLPYRKGRLLRFAQELAGVLHEASFTPS